MFIITSGSLKNCNSYDEYISTLNEGKMTPVGTGRVEARMERKKVERMYPPRLTKFIAI